MVTFLLISAVTIMAFSLHHRSRRVHSHQVSQVNRVFAGGFELRERYNKNSVQ
jgi:hypothetical protein